MTVDSGCVSRMALASQDVLAAELGGDAHAQVAALLLVQARDKGTDVRMMRQCQRERIQQHHESQMQALRDKANREYQAARAGSFGKLLDGGLTVASGCVMTKGENGVGTSQVLSGLGKASSASMDFLAAGDSRMAGRLHAVVAQEEHAVAEAKQQLEELGDEQADLQKLAKVAIDFLKDMQSAKEQVDRATAFHRA